MTITFGTGSVGIGADPGGISLYAVPSGAVGRVVPGTPASDTALVRLEFASADSLSILLRVLAAVRDRMGEQDKGVGREG